jgi:hypothetical protein
MVAHSLEGAVFGPGQRLHTATYVGCPPIRSSRRRQHRRGHRPCRPGAARGGQRVELPQSGRRTRASAVSTLQAAGHRDGGRRAAGGAGPGERWPPTRPLGALRGQRRTSSRAPRLAGRRQSPASPTRSGARASVDIVRLGCAHRSDRAGPRPGRDVMTRRSRTREIVGGACAPLFEPGGWPSGARHPA